MDPYCGLAAQLSEENRLESFTASALYKMENKLVTREVLEDTPYNPRYLVVKAKPRATERRPKRCFPRFEICGIKRSRDVFLCKTKEDYRRFLNRLLRNYPRGNVLAEEFIDGRQVIVEVLATNGTINIIAIIEQEIMINRNHFIVTGYNLVTKDETENYRKLKADVKKIIEKFGLVNGPCHLEMRCLNGEWKVIEMNPRISGGE